MECKKETKTYINTVVKRTERKNDLGDGRIILNWIWNKI